MTNQTEREYLTLHEFVKAARLRLDQDYWDYLIGGAETETTLKRNRMALDSVALRPRVLVDVTHIDTSHDFFGRKIRMPVGLAPVGSVESFTGGGTTTSVKAATDFGVPCFVSSASQPGLEGAAKGGDGPKVFQLYVRGDDDHISDHASRSIDAGYDAFCITVDTAHYSRRERDLAKRFRKSWRSDTQGHEFQSGLSWKNIERCRAKHKMPLIIKGIGTAEDAKLCVEHGVDVVYVSNHGGRQLDHGRGSLEVLPEVIEAVGGKAKVYVDGSVSRGTDVVKAVAMGADLVMVGRLYLYGLAADGAPGAVRLLEILQSEVEAAMALMGVTNLGQLNRSYVHAAQPVVMPGVHSAFPLLTFNEGY